MLLPSFLPDLLQRDPGEPAIFALLAGIATIGFLWCCIYLVALGLSVKEISDYKSFSFKDFFGNIKKGFKAGLILGLLLLAVFIILAIGIPFYLNMGSLFGILIAAFIFWSAITVFLALQYWFPIRARLDEKPLKILRKCFIVLIDNLGFSIFLALCNIVTLALSAFLGFLLPGPAATLLFLDEALRLRLYKYDWIEENPDADRKKIPWEALIGEDRDTTGTRSFRSFIFPWKD